MHSLAIIIKKGEGLKCKMNNSIKLILITKLRGKV